MAFDARLRSLRARLAALTLHASTDSTLHTAPARKAFLAKFEDLVDPDLVLPVAERLRRAAIARRAHFTRLALASARARSRSARRRANS